MRALCALVGESSGPHGAPDGDLRRIKNLFIRRYGLSDLSSFGDHLDSAVGLVDASGCHSKMTY